MVNSFSEQNRKIAESQAGEFKKSKERLGGRFRSGLRLNLDALSAENRNMQIDAAMDAADNAYMLDMAGSVFAAAMAHLEDTLKAKKVDGRKVSQDLDLIEATRKAFASKDTQSFSYRFKISSSLRTAVTRGPQGLNWFTRRRLNNVINRER